MAEPGHVRIEYLADYPTYVTEVGRLKYEQWLYTSPDRPYEVWIDEIRESARKDVPPITLVVLREAVLLGFVTLMEIDERAGIEGQLMERGRT